MGLAQMSALTGGRKFKRPYVEEINKRTAGLLPMYAQRKEDKYRDEMFGLQQAGLAQDKEFGLADLSLREDALSEQKKARKKANWLGYANIGLGAGLGVAGLASDNDWFKPATDSVVDMASPSYTDSILAFGKGAVSAPAQQAFDPASEFTAGLADFGGGVLKKIGGGIFDFGKGLYDSVVGDYLDMGDWSDFGDFG